MTAHPINKRGQLKTFISKELGIRASVVEMTDLVEDLSAYMGCTPSSSVALGRLLVGTVLVASQMKEDQAISFLVSGQGTIKKIFAHAQYDGLCRAYISEKKAPLSLANNNLSIAPLIGQGSFQAVTYIPNQRQPHTTQLELTSGEIGQDIAFYLNQSRQIPCVVSLAVKIAGEAKVVAAGGVLIELMPGHTEETLQKIEAQQNQAASLSGLIEKGESFDQLLKNHLGDFEMKEVRDTGVQYGCTCSRQKAGDSLKMLEPKDFQEILQSQETLNVDCEMCGLVYSFNTE